jgi:hypothetical protein
LIRWIVLETHFQQLKQHVAGMKNDDDDTKETKHETKRDFFIKTKETSTAYLFVSFFRFRSQSDERMNEVLFSIPLTFCGLFIHSTY